MARDCTPSRGLSKQLLPVYDKPMIYYPLSVLMLAGIKQILIISSPEYLPAFQRLLGDGEIWGTVALSSQAKPDGLAQAFLIGKDFIGDDNVCLILGDNIFYGPGFGESCERIARVDTGATIFAYEVLNPRQFGVAKSIRTTGRYHRGKAENLNQNLPLPVFICDNAVVEITESVAVSQRV